MTALRTLWAWASPAERGAGPLIALAFWALLAAAWALTPR